MVTIVPYKPSWPGEFQKIARVLHNALGDLALRIALQKLKRIDSKLDEKQAREMVESWSPYRSAGSLFLWHYYRGAPT